MRRISFRLAKVHAQLVLGLLAASACSDSPLLPILEHRIAFLQYVNGAARLYSINEDGTDLRLLSSQASFGAPSWSPDGRRVAFATVRGTSRGIAVVDVDGSNARQLAEIPDLYSGPAWSPSGQSIAYIVQIDGREWRIMQMDADGRNHREIAAPAGYKDELSWSPDGQALAFVLERRICILAASGGELSCPVEGSSPAWSPDGTHLAFSGWIADPPNRDIYVLEIRGGAIARLTTDPRDEWAGSWSPDGKRIVFERGRSGIQGGYDLFVMNVDGSTVRPLSDGSTISFAPAWQPRPR